MLAAAAVAIGTGVSPVTAQDEPAKPASEKPVTLEDLDVTLKTPKGDIKLTLYASKAPVSVANFLNLAKRGYYDGVIFHKVVENFMALTGDPSGTGRGGPGYFIENEIVEDLKHDRAGILAMARKLEPDTNGSQFFITLGATPHLDGNYTIFGEVTDGLVVVESLEKGDTIDAIEVHGSTDPLFTKMEARLDEWNAILDMRADAQKKAKAAAASSGTTNQ